MFVKEESTVWSKLTTFLIGDHVYTVYINNKRQFWSGLSGRSSTEFSLFPGSYESWGWCSSFKVCLSSHFIRFTKKTFSVPVTPTSVLSSSASWSSRAKISANFNCVLYTKPTCGVKKNFGGPTKISSWSKTTGLSLDEHDPWEEKGGGLRVKGPEVVGFF